MLYMLGAARDKKVVYQWEIDIIKNWRTDEIKNRIWMAKELGHATPGCVSIEAMRVELIRRGEQPNGYHENEDIDMSNIEIERVYRRGR